MPLEKTLEGFGALVRGEVDDLPEQAFYMVGPLEEVRDKAVVIAADLKKRREGWFQNILYSFIQFCVRIL